MSTGETSNKVRSTEPEKKIRYTTSRLEIIDGVRRVDPMERPSFHEAQLRKCLMVLHPTIRQRFLDWMAEAELGDVGVAELGAKFTPLRHKCPVNRGDVVTCSDAQR